MSTDYSRSGQERLLRQLRTLGRHADVVLLETGNSSSEVVRRFWLAADEILVVTTPQPVAVMDCYATLKRLAASGRELPIRLIVNKSADRNTAEDVHRRINTSCQRFLGMELGLLGHVPPHARFESSPEENLSITSSSPMDAGTASLEAMIVQLMDRIGEPTRGDECADQPLTNVNKQVDSAQPRPAHWPIVR
jgi:flagellar biosynthesis protein FlhG